ncbi:hypothetical protein HT576_09770 [Haloterrigena sp. SYSU A121-1]|uniref:Uncharacterized protein n=1 Tax=Haloterrigena gelatinilytica TaxID=2741724 RepID=A0A8J8GLC8_9EURY|nr:hypothetical protein [Haloterrigena gelatinilytica]NUB91305.1 hypothetical protein [Haloterrigena gelatinilytica]
MTDPNTPTIHLSTDGCPHDDEACETAFERQLAQILRSAVACDVALEGGWGATVPSDGQEYAIEIWKVDREGTR